MYGSVVEPTVEYGGTTVGYRTYRQVVTKVMGATYGIVRS